MTTETARRHALYEHARDSWGAETAETLMDLLPADRDQLATKTDLGLVGAELRTDMAELRAEMRTDMAELRAEVRTDMAELRADMAEKFSDQTRTLMIASVTTMLSGVGLAFAAAHFA